MYLPLVSPENIQIGIKSLILCSSFFQLTFFNTKILAPFPVNVPRLRIGAEDDLDPGLRVLLKLLDLLGFLREHLRLAGYFDANRVALDFPLFPCGKRRLV